MSNVKTRFLCSLSLLLVLAPNFAMAQQSTGQSPTLGAAADSKLNRDANIQAYVDLLRADVRQEKVQVLSQVMSFSPADASIFWPIYTEYDAELTILADRRIEFIQQYLDNYGVLTDSQADELVYGLLDLQVERTGLQRNYYDRVKTSMDSVTAARFLQVESQLLKLIDLQIMSNLPAVE
jgi:hypothetical protein